MMVKKTAIPINVNDEKQILDEIVRLVHMRWDFMIDRKVSKANKISDQLYKLEQHIPLLPDKGRHMLLTLAQSPEDELRMVAADNLIPLEPKTAKRMLSDLAKNASNVHIKIIARTTLEEWKAGRLTTPYPRSFLG